MASTYRVYLTEKTADSPHPVETVQLIDGLTTSAAFEMCFALNEGGKLREGIEAHFTTEESFEVYANDPDADPGL